MRTDSLARLLRTLPEDALVLDVGGWAKPLSRADWVIDHMPYETRGLYGHDGDPTAERFSASTWIVRDICDREPFPFPDKHFDFVVCSHVLEDVRDPIWVCREMARVGKAGYIETPSRLEEQSYGFQGPWVGWGHHRWLVEVENGRLVFVLKHHVIHGRASDHFPAWFHSTLTEEEKTVAYWWHGDIPAEERIFMTPDELDGYLADFVARELSARLDRRPRPGLCQRLRAVAGRIRRSVRRR